MDLWQCPPTVVKRQGSHTPHETNRRMLVSQTQEQVTARATRLAVVAIKETAPGERRVALAPDSIGRLKAAGLDVLVEAGAGTGASFADDAYVKAGASIVRGDEGRLVSRHVGLRRE